MLVVTHDTIRNPAILETRSLPRKFFGRVQIFPRRGGVRVILRMLLEVQILRYLGALLPFVAIPLMSRDLALPVTQAPLAMLVVIAFVELKVLRLSKPAREKLVSADEADRRLDALSFRGKAALRQIAARRDLREGTVMLVIEQSELARISPLTLVSVQAALPRPHVLDLDAGDRAVLEQLFDAELTERALQQVNLRDDQMIREISIEARAVSAHARLAAYLEDPARATTVADALPEGT